MQHVQNDRVLTDSVLNIVLSVSVFIGLYFKTFYVRHMFLINFIPVSKVWLCDDLGTCWPSHATFHSRWPCLCGCLERPAGGRAVVPGRPASAQVGAFPAFPGPKTLHV